MAMRKRIPKTARRTPSKGGKKPTGTTGLKVYSSPAWERIDRLAMKLDLLAKEIGLHTRERDPEGFDLLDAARELARLAGNHDRARNPDGRTPAQEKDDWVAIGGLGADLGNMAVEPTYAQVSEGVRAIAHEVCYRACDYLF
jgi:hypothetical protein